MTDSHHPLATAADRQEGERATTAGVCTVVYVMGLWRSGSTILDIVLGSHPEAVSAGELRNLPAFWAGGGGDCACGEPVASCRFWSRVRSGWSQAIDEGDPARRLRELQDRYERLRSFPRLISQHARRSSEFREYGTLLAALYEQISRYSGKSVVVDSTKYPARALALLQIPHLRVRLIHLVRDGRAVIWSCLRKPNTDLQGRPLEERPEVVVRQTIRQWSVVNLACEAVIALERPRFVRVRYEDFVSQPVEELQRMASLLDLDMGRVASYLEEARELPIGHVVAGNRVRMSGAVRLEADIEWRSKLAPTHRRSFWRAAGWLARRYGYGSG